MATTFNWNGTFCCNGQDLWTQSKSGIEDLDSNISNVLHLLFTVSLYPVVAIFGVATNIVSIVVFTKQGLKNTVNLTLVALAVADVCSLVALLFLSLCYNPLFADSDVPLYSTEAAYLLAGMPRLCFSRIESLIIAFVTLERCLCVRFPLKVSSILTPRRSLVVIVAIFISMIVSLLPVYFSTKLDWKTYPDRQNQTFLGLVYTNDRRQIDRWTFALGSFFGMCSLVTVVVCSLDLVSSLVRSRKWRQTTCTGSNLPSRRDKRTGKMVLVISLIFVVTFVPLNAVQLCMSTIPRFNKGSDIPNIYNVTWSVGYFIEAINCWVNIFIYFKMSSRYKSVVKEMLAKQVAICRSKCR